MPELNETIIDSFKSIAVQNSIVHPDCQVQDFMAPDSSEKTRISLTLTETLLLKVSGEEFLPHMRRLSKSADEFVKLKDLVFLLRNDETFGLL